MTENAQAAQSIMYGDDLAYVHHVGFADFSRSAGPGILKMLLTHHLESGTVVDLGCGGGQWLRLLSDAGYTAVGIDASRSFVRLARQTAPIATIRFGSLWKYQLPACSAVTALGEVLSYLPPKSSRPPSLRRLFSLVHSALHENGLFVFDMLTKSKQQPMRYRTWRAEKDWAVLADVQEDARNGRLHRAITTFRRSRGTYRRSLEHHVSRIMARAEIVELLRSVGFTVRTSTRYGNFELPPHRTVFQARRR